MSWETVSIFEKEIAKFYGAPYAVAVDSCTHGIELCLRLVNAKYISCPKNTYLSIPMLANKLGIELKWKDDAWVDYCAVHGGHYRGPIYDAAVLWRKDSYIFATMMCISFQYQKHLSLGRGGMILLSDKWDALALKKMSYDGRLPGIPWREQNVNTMGYHYYMTVETAQLGLDKLENAINTKPRQWTIADWPDLTKMDIFK